MIMIFFERLIIIFFAIILISCSKIQLDKTSTTNYKLDLLITHEKSGIERAGIIALPKLDRYDLEFEAGEKISILTFRTCSRELVVENPKVLFNRKKYKFTYSPNEIEKGPACSAEISVYNDNKMYSVGHIEFKDSLTTLQARNICGQYTEITEGLSVCQERMGSIEKISFGSEVIVSPSQNCALSADSGREFTYQVKKGFCLYNFMEVMAPNRVHRLVTYGYEEINLSL